MVFKRKIYKKLVEWKEQSQGDRALLVEGARRIGKSTIVEEFAKKEYKSYLFIDFAQAADTVLEYFRENKNNLNELFMLLSLEYGVKLYERESLVVFDEVQRFPAREFDSKKQKKSLEALQTLHFFVKFSIFILRLFTSSVII